MRESNIKAEYLSFKNQVKNDLTVLSDESEGCVRAELAGLLMPNTKLVVDDRYKPLKLLFRTDNQGVAEWTAENVERLFQIQSSITEGSGTAFKNSRVFELSFEKGLENMLKDLRLLKRGNNGILMMPSGIPPYFKTRQSHLKAFLRGIFLSCGAITDPEKAYRLEISGTKTALLRDVMEVLSFYGIHLKLTTRHGLPVIWTKEAESVALFLNLIGAHKALFKVEDLRALREVRNEVNRRVNCDLANLKKTSAASEKQLAVIHQIETQCGLDNLPAELKELAFLRKENPEATTQELGEMTDPPISKSAVFKRFQKMARWIK